MRNILISLLFIAAANSLAIAGNVPVGYSNGKVAEESNYTVLGKGNISAAMRVTSKLTSRYVGADVNGVRVGLASAKYCDSIVVWVRESLDGENIVSGTIRRSDAQAPGKGWNEVLFDTSYKLQEGKDFYLGYTYTQRYKDAAVSVVGEPMENISFIKKGNVAPWQDISADGVLSLEMLLGGDVIPAYDLKVKPSVGLQSTFNNLDVFVEVANQGRMDAVDYDLSFSADGYSYVYTSNVVVPSGKTVMVPVHLSDMPQGVGFGKTLSVSVSRIGGGVDAYPSDNTADIEIKMKRNVVVEEHTGTGCGWCPRGLVGMDKLHDKYGLSFVGIAIHQFNRTDPMYPSAYKDVGLYSAPSCIIDRDFITDPYFGNAEDICVDFEEEMNKGARLGVEVYANYDYERTAVEITASILTQEDFSGTSIGFVLTADSLTGTSSSWLQSNYYTQYDKSAQPEELAEFCKGGEKGTSKFSWVYNDVAISTYKDGDNFEMPLGDLKKYESKTVTATLDMPTKEILLNAIKYDKVAANVFVVGNDGKIINAARFYVDVLNGVHEVGFTSKANAVEVSRYSLDGRRISAPQKGVNIIRLSDGTTQKVLVK